MSEEKLGRGSSYHDIDYGLASASIATTGLVAIATTGADYHGIALIAGTVACTVIVYDSASATGGNIIDIIKVNPGGNAWNDRISPVKAKLGLTISKTGTGASGTVFYNPKG